MVSPAEFIPIAEETGLIDELGEWVLTTACAEATTWPDEIRLAVNVSPVQFRSGTLALKIVAALAASGLPANRLELEITEAVLIRDDEAALAILHQLRAIGVRIALDDFGTGYSSLSYLQRFPFDKIKIDRCFVNDIAEPDGSSCIVQAVVNIAAARHMTTTAEGVETQQQRNCFARSAAPKCRATCSARPSRPRRSGNCCSRSANARRPWPSPRDASAGEFQAPHKPLPRNISPRLAAAPTESLLAERRA
jgi:EAL domain-containing protein (putative c-di-GMP-specific phosphodiesterase class I)